MACSFVGRRDDLRRLAGRLLVLAGVVYLLYALVAGAGELGRLDWTAYAAAAAVGFALYPVSLFAQAVAWALAVAALRRNELTVDWRDVRIYASSHLARRLPGGVWHLVSRVAAYRQRGVATGLPLLASAGELLVLLGAAGAVRVATALFPAAPAPAALVAVLLAGLAGWAIGELAGRAPWSPAAPGRPRAGRAGLAYLAIAELYLLALATGGVILWAFLAAGGAADPSLLGATATWALAAALGTLLGLIPGSIGAREITLFVVLVGALGAPVAALVAVLFRLLFVAGDLLWGATLLLLARRLAGPELRDAAG